MLFDYEYAHTGCPKKRVPEEGEIGRTSTIRNFLTYLLGARPRTTSARRNLDFDHLPLT